MSEPTATVYLSLGANLGDRMASLAAAVLALGALDSVRVGRVSSVYETEPWGVIAQPLYLNLAVEIETALGPLELLRALKALEATLGRRPSPRWDAREIDLDILLWGDRVLKTPALTIPHERFRERAFVLTPLAEIAPDVVDPETGATVAELSRRLGREGVAVYAAALNSS